MQVKLVERRESTQPEGKRGVPFTLVQPLFEQLLSHDPETAEHTLRVSALAEHIARAVGLNAQQIDEIKAGTLLHDLGKIDAPDTILHKNGPLTPLEAETMHRHPVDGYRRLGVLASFNDLTACVLSHHERLDGSGYPFGLKGDQIPMAAQICAVADSFDAITCKRTYKPSLPNAEALEILAREASKGKLNAMLVGVLRDLIEDQESESKAA